MAMNTGTILVLICLWIALVFWLTSMVTPGWIRETYNDTSTNVIDDKRWSIFYIKVCIKDKCDHFSYQEFYKEQNGRYHFEMLDFQIISATALILCTLSGIIVIAPIKSTSTKMFIVVIITPVAATVECILILFFITINVRLSLYESLYYIRLSQFPYSIVLSALGTVFALIGCVISVAVYHKSRDEEIQRKISTMGHVIHVPLTVVEYGLSTEE